jgi:hypothetical protein
MTRRETIKLMHSLARKAALERKLAFPLEALSTEGRRRSCEERARILRSQPLFVQRSLEKDYSIDSKWDFDSRGKPLGMGSRKRWMQEQTALEAELKAHPPQDFFDN